MNALKPIFLGAEDGTAALDVERFPQPRHWPDVLAYVNELATEQHSYKTLVVDTLDWAEPMLWDWMCEQDSDAKNKLTNIEDYGYGKGYNRAIDHWRAFIRDLERMRHAKGMHVIFLAHSRVKSFKNPEGQDYDRYEMKIHEKAAGLLKEWCDVVLFAKYEEYAVEDKRTKRYKGVDNSGARIMFTERRAAYDAKNRYGLPERLPLSWPDFVAAVAAGKSAEPAVLVEEITRKAKQVGGKLEQDTLASLGRCGEDANKLAQLNDWLNTKLEERKG
jgi:hypothetical protein